MGPGRVNRNLLRGFVNSLPARAPPGQCERNSKPSNAPGPQKPQPGPSGPETGSWHLSPGWPWRGVGDQLPPGGDASGHRLRPALLLTCDSWAGPSRPPWPMPLLIAARTTRAPTCPASRGCRRLSRLGTRLPPTSPSAPAPPLPAGPGGPRRPHLPCHWACPERLLPAWSAPRALAAPGRRGGVGPGCMGGAWGTEGRGQDARAPPPEVDKSRQIKWPGNGDGVISGKLKTQPHSLKNWGGGGKGGVRSNLGPAQGPQSWGQITKNSFSALNKDLALPQCTGVSSDNLRSKKLKYRDYHSLIVGSSSGPLCYSKVVRARVFWTPKFRDTEKWK